MIVVIEVEDPATRTPPRSAGWAKEGFLDGAARQVEGWFSKIQNAVATGARAAVSTDVPDDPRKLDEIDRQLTAAIDQPELWRKRAFLCLENNQRPAALVSDLTACILGNDAAAFLQKVREFAKSDQDLRALFDPHLPETEKGRILSVIRRARLEAEFHYAFNLAFAATFADAAIFAQAVDSMRTGYSGERRPFLGLAEATKQLGLLRPEEMAKIKSNVTFFIRRMGGIGQVTHILEKQFHILLTAHLGEKTANTLIPPDKLSSCNCPRCRDLAVWPGTGEGGAVAVRDSAERWHKLVGMERLKEISLAEMFTGDLYRPVFRYAQSISDSWRELTDVPWMRDLPPGVIPAESDGKPIARAIFQRFSLGGLGRDWDLYFRNARGRNATIPMRARAQRVLLWLVSEFGPLRDFEEHIVPFEFFAKEFMQDSRRLGSAGVGQKRDIFLLTLCCDSFRLHQVYQNEFDSQKVFVKLLNGFPLPPDDWVHFRDSAEQVIFCLFLDSSPGRTSMLATMLDRALRWAGHACRVGNEEMLDEVLTVMSYLEVGVLMDQLPKAMGKHHLHERRRALWMEHARNLAIGKEAAFKKWISTSR